MAGQNAKTGFANVRIGVGALMAGGGRTLAERFGPTIGYGISVGDPVGAGKLTTQ